VSSDLGGLVRRSDLSRRSFGEGGSEDGSGDFLRRKEKTNHQQLNYAKRTQFPKKSNGRNISINNELQRKMQNGHLVKTNPNEPNLW